MDDMVRELSTATSILWERRIVAVKTKHGVRIAEKLAKLVLFDEDIRCGDLIISTIYNTSLATGADRWYAFHW